MIDGAYLKRINYLIIYVNMLYSNYTNNLYIKIVFMSRFVYIIIKKGEFLWMTLNLFGINLLK